MIKQLSYLGGPTLYQLGASHCRSGFGGSGGASSAGVGFHPGLSPHGDVTGWVTIEKLWGLQVYMIWDWNRQSVINLPGIYMGPFPKIRDPQIIFFRGIFLHKPTIFLDTPIDGNPHMYI